MPEQNSQEPKREKPRIDPDVPHYEEHNQDAARQLGWRYDKRNRRYRDSDGELIADRFGQPL